jgi:hypothetical protein
MNYKKISLVIPLFAILADAEEPTQPAKVEAKVLPEVPSEQFNREIVKKGNLQDQREYVISASIAPEASKPNLLLDLKLTIAGVAINIPENSWKDLLVVPDKESFSVSDFAGEIRLSAQASINERTGVAILFIKENRVTNRQFTWTKKSDGSDALTSATLAGSENISFSPPQAAMQGATIPLPASTLKIGKIQQQTKP